MTFTEVTGRGMTVMDGLCWTHPNARKPNALNKVNAGFLLVKTAREARRQMQGLLGDFR